jgi:hypothetical protein
MGGALAPPTSCGVAKNPLLSWRCGVFLLQMPNKDTAQVRYVMTGFEYKVIPAPLRGLKGKGIKGTPARFANALQLVMNDLGAQGWEYQRKDPTSRRTRRFNKKIDVVSKHVGVSPRFRNSARRWARSGRIDRRSDLGD